MERATDVEMQLLKERKKKAINLLQVKSTGQGDENWASGNMEISSICC
jgi:hypothetical protein